ncbi:CDP-alcohol phosphatidyltransferase family protein [Pseudovibrio ascidiaceicola]|uniref:CDP-alcohol phosphatidyltransferase family protein n=1 Tax=Pseudovibrio ascidiaceicola TaxID=285279 RepID=UPI003D363288
MNPHKSVLQHAYDLPNLVSLLNVILGFLSIVAVTSDAVLVALILMQAAVFFDHLDGHLARRHPNREMSQKQFGGELDTLADLINFGVVPGLICFALLGQTLIGVLVGLIILTAGVLRLAYFTVYSSGQNGFFGITTTYAGFALGVVVALLKTFELSVYPALPLAVITLAVTEISTFRMPKFQYSIWAVLIATSLVAGWLYLVFQG